MENHEHHHPTPPQRQEHRLSPAAANGVHAHHASAGGEHGEHDKHKGHSVDGFRRKFWLSLALTVPILLLSDMIQHFFGFHFDFAGRKWVLFGLSSILFAYGNQPFLAGAVAELRHRIPGMMTLIALATTVAFVYSVAVTFGLPGMDFYWELATLIVVMLLGHWIEMKTVSGASRALEMLVSLMPAEAHVMQASGTVEDHPVQHLQVGQVVLVKANEKIPADGEVVEGESYVNESMLTGESQPVAKAIGAKVIAGAVNGNSTLKIRVTGAGQDSYLQKVVRMVQEAQASKSKTQNLADRAARWLTYLAIGAGLLTLGYWLWVGQTMAFALERMVTVMVIACPHALGLAIPLVVAISTALSAQHGLLIRNRTAFENSRKITAIVFDKTGTLTEGAFGVNRVVTVSTKYNEQDILQLAASLEQNSEHPIALGIVRFAEEKGVKLLEVRDFQSLTAQGIQGKIGGKDVLVVSPNYLKSKNIALPESVQSKTAETVVFVLVGGQLAGFIALADRLRKTSAAAVAAFQNDGVKVIMATGDNKQVAESVRRELRLNEVFAEVLPHQKVEIVKELQAEGEFVAMTGDGVNDAPALAQADVGIAVGSGTDVAAETADIILVNSDPQDILRLVRFGKATYRKMIQNLFWATAYNLVAIPVAAGLFYPKLMISPAFGAVLMSVSTIIVALNAQLLRRGLQ
ncbi:MAG: copper-translocating P-type ATPase [Haliscomenobacteraceae bacterium CHB4]|nr:copper-translocating P-type ATPase [Haliscomenobacteraceae bacterium CHB4]